MFSVLPQLHEFDMCIAKNEEALRIEPHFAECYGNMANAWKVMLQNTKLPGYSIPYIYVVLWNFSDVRGGVLMIQDKGNSDLAIRYYLIAIEVCTRFL